MLYNGDKHFLFKMKKKSVVDSVVHMEQHPVRILWW